MQLNYDKNAQRKPVNLTANTDLVNRVRAAKGNLSALFEQSMLAFLERKELELWREQNRAAFESYNRMIDEDGLFSDDMGLL